MWSRKLKKDPRSATAWSGIDIWHISAYGDLDGELSLLEYRSFEFHSPANWPVLVLGSAVPTETLTIHGQTYSVWTPWKVYLSNLSVHLERKALHSRFNLVRELILLFLEKIRRNSLCCFFPLRRPYRSLLCCLRDMYGFAVLITQLITAFTLVIRYNGALQL